MSLFGSKGSNNVNEESTLNSIEQLYKINPNDGDLLHGITKKIYIGGTGDLSVEMKKGNSVTLKNVPQGFLSLALKKVKQSGTTATEILGEFEESLKNYLLGTRVGFPEKNGAGLTSQTEITYRTFHVAAFDTDGVYLVFGSPIGFSNTFQLKCSIEINGQITPVYFNKQRTITVNPGDMITSDKIEINMISGGEFFLRTYAKVPSGGKLPAYLEGKDTFGDGYVNFDATDEGTITAINIAHAYTPIAILGESLNYHPSIALIGDSIVDGQGDTYTTASPTKQNKGTRGYLERALANSIGYMNHGIVAERAADFIATNNTKSTYRMETLKFSVNHAIVEYGVNDFQQGQTVDKIKSSLQTLWNNIAAKGIRVYQCTITPVTNSTDSWTTTTNQTVKFADTVRTELNDWIRTKPAPLTGYFEIADLAETSRNSGIWKARYTADGIHPNATGVLALVPGVDISIFF